MSTTQDLMGLGLPGPLASRLGYTPVLVTGAGTSAGTATKITTKNALLNSTTSNTGAILDSALSLGSFTFIACATGSTASGVIYPPSGCTITNASSVTLAADKNMIVWRYSSTLFFHVILA